MALGAVLLACGPQPIGQGGDKDTQAADDKSDNATGHDDATDGTNTHSDSSMCEELSDFHGNLKIGDETDPHELRCVEHVLGSVLVLHTNELTDLRWLANLRQIDGDLRIEENESLEALTGLERLEAVGGRLSVEGNTVLTDLRGLGGVKEVQFVNIRLNPSLTDLTSLRGDVRFRGEGSEGLTISDNPNLTTLAGLGAIETVTAEELMSISVSENSRLGDLEGLRAFGLTGQDVNLNLYGNPNLESLGSTSFRFLNEASLTYLPSLTSLAGIDDETIHVLQLHGVDALTSLEGLESVQQINDLWIGPCLSGNASLTSLAGLENLTRLNVLIVLDNPALASIAALRNVTEVEAGWIVRNGKLAQDEVEAFVAQLDSPPVGFETCGNLGGPSCEPVECPPYAD